MFVSILTVLLGLLILLISARNLIGNIVDLAKRLNISQFIIASCTIAIGTSLPELSASIESVTSGLRGVAVGNLIGSNIANIFLVLGLSATIYPIKIYSDKVVSIKRDASIAVVLFPAAIFFLRFDGFNSVLISILALIFFFYFVNRIMSLKKKLNTYKAPKDSIYFLILKNICFIGGLILGTKIFIDSAMEISEHFKITERVIGLSIVAIGTSLPELTICVAAALKKKQGIAFGTVLGSNMYNILFILSFVEIWSYSKFDETSIVHHVKPGDILTLALSSLLIFYFIRDEKSPNEIDRKEGLILFLFYIIYIYIVYRT